MKTPTSRHLLLPLTAALLAASVLSLTACGGGKTVKVESENSVSMGQELHDLDKAYKDGVISKSEYEKAKKKILDGKR
jgi:hypothetical protein